MKLSKLTLENFRGIQQLSINLDSQLTVLTGKSEAVGKTSILDAIYLTVPWLLSKANKNSSQIDPSDMTNSAHYTSISVEGEFGIVGKLSLNWSATSKFALSEAMPHSEKFPACIYLSDCRYVGSDHVFESFIKQFGEYEYRSKNSEQAARNVQLIQDLIPKFLPKFKAISHDNYFKTAKEFEAVRLSQLSKSEKVLLSMISNIAIKLIAENSDLENPLEGLGLVLIDDIEAHLHPSQLRNLITQLPITFPNCQFIISTNSPIVLSEVEGKKVRVLYNKVENGVGLIDHYTPNQTLGLEPDLLYETILNTNRYSATVQEKLDEIHETVDQEDFKKARGLIAKLEQSLNGSIPETAGIGTFIDVLES